jgi:hypothetical protein
VLPYFPSSEKFDKGESIDPQDFSIYEHFSPEDFALDPDWLFAPVLVATSEEQINITRQKCSLWAKLHKTYEPLLQGL